MRELERLKYQPYSEAVKESERLLKTELEDMLDRGNLCGERAKVQWLDEGDRSTSKNSKRS